MSEPLPLHGIHYWEFKIKVHARQKERVEEPHPTEAKSEESKAADIENTSGIVLSTSHCLNQAASSFGNINNSVA